jgi:Ser/Thr protein kinase RdoA (MazF antagonist)
MTNSNQSDASLKKIAAAFGCAGNPHIEAIEKGLINKTFLVQANGEQPMLLQRINTGVFKDPLAIQTNYQLIHNHLQQKGIFIPALIKTVNGELLYLTEKGNVMRAFAYVTNSFSIDAVHNASEVVSVAKCFGSFAAAFKDFPVQQLRVIIPDFHNLEWRFLQFQQAVESSTLEISEELHELIGGLLERKNLVKMFATFSDEKRFPLRVMHHDCKINNILFDKSSGQLICPVDMDTVMPGKFFSDLGDMIRTMCCTQDENSVEWDEIGVNVAYYEAVISTYSEAVDDLFTTSEKENLHYSGLIIIYMQALRFLTDYLKGNIYYKILYPGQNFDRAKNQFLLLCSLEILLEAKHNSGDL